MLTAEGFKTFCYPGVRFVTSRSDHRLRLSCDADVPKSLHCLNCGNFSFLLPPSSFLLPSALSQPRSPKVAKTLNVSHKLSCLQAGAFMFASRNSDR
jgi:hypothetical protein